MVEETPLEKWTETQTRVLRPETAMSWTWFFNNPPLEGDTDPAYTYADHNRGRSFRLD